LKIECARVEEEREKDDVENSVHNKPSAIAIYHQLMMADHEALLVKRLLEARALENSMWSEEFASEFKDLGSEIVHQADYDDVEVVGDDVPEEQEEEMSESELLLTVRA
jgi:hypothetical protein